MEISTPTLLQAINDNVFRKNGNRHVFYESDGASTAQSIMNPCLCGYENSKMYAVFASHNALPGLLKWSYGKEMFSVHFMSDYK